MEKVTLKLRYKDDLRRVSLRQPLLIADVEDHVVKVFGLPSFLITYVDEEGDKIIVSTNEELRDLVLVSDTPVLRLNIEEKIEEGLTPQESPNIKVENKSTVRIPVFSHVSSPEGEAKEPSPPTPTPPPFVPPPLFPQFTPPPQDPRDHLHRQHPFHPPPLFPSFCPPPLGRSFPLGDNNQCCPFSICAFLFVSFLFLPMLALFSFRIFISLFVIGFSFIIFFPIFRCMANRIKRCAASRQRPHRKHRFMRRFAFKVAFLLFVFVALPIWMYYFRVPLYFALPLALVVISMVIRRCVKRRQRQSNLFNQNQSQAPPQEQAPQPQPQPQPEQQEENNQPQITSERLEALSRLVVMGFEVKAANAALDRAGGNDVEAALEVLL